MCLAAWHTQGYAGSHLIPFSSRRRHEFSLGCMRVYNGGDGGELTRMWTGSPCDVTTQESLHGGRRGSAGGPGAERVRRDLTPEVASPTSGASVRGHQEGFSTLPSNGLVRQRAGLTLPSVGSQRKWPYSDCVLPLVPSSLGPTAGLWAEQGGLGALSWEREGQASGPPPPSIYF